MVDGDPKMVQMSPEDIQELRETIQRLSDEEDNGLDESISITEFVRKEIPKLPSAQRTEFEQAFEAAIQSALKRFERLMRGQ